MDDLLDPAKGILEPRRKGNPSGRRRPEERDALTEDDLKDFDQDHYGGVEALNALADKADIRREHLVLDVCSGMGGPARWLAWRRGCRVSGLEFTQSRVEGARRLTRRAKLDALVEFVQGDATAMPLPGSHYDVLISQGSWLHIPDKAALLAECVRVLKPAGTIAFTDVVVRTPLGASEAERLGTEMHAVNIASAESYRDLLTRNGCMYRSLRNTTIAKFGEARFLEYDYAYSHFVGLFMGRQARRGTHGRAQMKPRVTLITLGVDDLKKSLAFYRDGLGLPTQGIVGEQFEHGAVAFFDLQPGLKLALWPRDSIAHDSGIARTARSATELALGHNVASREEVDEVMRQAEGAGARIVKRAQDTFWGGYAGYFQDPDGHLWEIAWNPEFEIKE